ncbi:MAG: amidohydrolase [Bacteroidota bacterium]|nr:amidohydrolase [Odoribacter sp.]MDP3644576.1 amidohydrolase [Bacteroidota bacterium]
MSQEILSIAVFQLDLVWENPAANREKIDEWLLKANKKTDVVFLPEMFATGFSMNAAELAEPMDGETVNWMKKCSSEHQLALCGSLIIRENNQYFNRLLFVEPSGEIHFYNKRHLFTMGNEESHFQKGTERLVVDFKGWRICPLICYDLRFPVWARNRNEYDILVYSANWPQSRTEVWNTLLKARAIENQSYVVGANRVGVDGNTVSYSGNSQLIDPKGNILAEIGDHHKGIIIAGFSHSELMNFRAAFPVLNDADSFTF